MPKVSVLIPCYNSARFVADAVEAALGQTHQDVEVIVIDDGSTDGSVDVLKRFDNRIIFEAGPNRGACSARNRAFELSSGDLIQFLDADDKLDPHKLSKQIRLMETERADMVLCKIGLFGDDRGERPEKRPHPAPDGDAMMYFAAYGIQTAAPLYTRRLFERSGGFLPGLKRGQEADLHIRLGALNPRINMLDEILVWVRMHDGERITNKPPDINQIVTTLIHQADFIERNGVWTDARREWIARNLLQSARACFATGDKAVASKGILRAIEVNPAVTHQDRLFRKLLSACVGPVKAEHLIDRARSIVK